MLNERHVNNKFTSMFTKGLSVVNYVVLSHLELIKCSNLEIQRVRHLIDSADLLHGVVCDPDHNRADHSVIAAL